jgi:hypothetical protein
LVNVYPDWKDLSFFATGLALRTQGHSWVMSQELWFFVSLFLKLPAFKAWKLRVSNMWWLALVKVFTVLLSA